LRVLGPGHRSLTGLMITCGPVFGEHRRIAFIDNGAGMIPEMARYALSWGGGTHFDDPSFIGKFGFGLPNSSINQTRRVEVYTKTDPSTNFVRAHLDITQFGEYGIQEIPAPEPADLPAFVESYVERHKLDLRRG